jgi:hypothetical protein
MDTTLSKATDLKQVLSKHEKRALKPKQKVTQPQFWQVSVNTSLESIGIHASDGPIRT